MNLMSIMYTTRRCDTLAGIARRHHCSVSDLIAANPQLITSPVLRSCVRMNIPVTNANGTDAPEQTPQTGTPQAVNPNLPGVHIPWMSLPQIQTPGTTITPTTPEMTTTPSGPNTGSGETTPGTSGTPQSPPSGNTGTNNGIEAEVIALVNQERANRGIAPLTYNGALANVARTKSEDMAENNYFSHNSPTYGSPFDMMQTFGITYSTAGENIAKGQTSAAEVMNAWMNSSGHAANIMNSNFSEIGVGYVYNGGVPIWTQMFIHP